MIIALEEAKSKLYILQEDLTELGRALRVEELKASVFDEEQQTMDPAFWNDPDKSSRVLQSIKQKKAIIENAMGYDAKDDRLAGNPNQMNIQSMYSDIDLDANGMETEFQASFEELLWFINNHFANMGVGEFENEEVEVIFNRDIMISESEVIENIQKSVGILSEETLVAQHPWIDDVQAELERLKKQKEEEVEQYGSAFQPMTEDEEM